MKMNIETIPHIKQRYDTCGDYWIDKDGVLQVRISIFPGKLGKIYSWLVLLHEMVEIFLCQTQGVKFKDIDAFDMKYEADRSLGLHGDTEEPGDDKNAPYGRQHRMATAVERMLCSYLDTSWYEYDSTVGSLDYKACPHCGTTLVATKEIGSYCPNKKCPVAEDYKLRKWEKRPAAVE